MLFVIEFLKILLSLTFFLLLSSENIMGLPHLSLADSSSINDSILSQEIILTKSLLIASGFAIFAIGFTIIASGFAILLTIDLSVVRPPG